MHGGVGRGVPGGGVQEWCTLATLPYPGVLPWSYYPALLYPAPVHTVSAVHTAGPVVYTARVVRGAVLALLPLLGPVFLTE